MKLSAIALQGHKHSNPLIREAVLDLNARITYGAIPKTIKEVQNKFISEIKTNTFFTLEEQNALSDYFQNYSSINSKYVTEYLNEVDENIGDWFKSGLQKVKQAFGGIKEYVVKVWTQIKEVFVKLIQKGIALAKGIVNKARSKAKAAINAVADKAALYKEVIHMIDCHKFLEAKLKDPKLFVVGLDGKVIGGVEQKAQDELNESVFTKELTEQLVNKELLLESGGSKWQKWIMNTIKIVMNPLMGGLGVLGSYAGSKLLSYLAKLIEKLGGPKAISYHVTPELMMAGLEISGAYDSMWAAIEKGVEEFAKNIPFVGTLMHLWHYGHYILLAYAYFEVAKEVIYPVVKTVYKGSTGTTNESIRLASIL